MSRLIKQAKTSPEAFTRLYETHVDAVYQYCAYRTHTIEEAEDLTSEVWENALIHIRELKSNHPIVFKGWLFKIAQNCIYKHWKKKTPEGLGEEAECIQSEELNPEQESKRQNEAEELRTLVKALAPQQQETVALHFFSGLRNKEIAKILDLSEKTVASNLSRALDTLHGWLKKLQ